MRKQEEKKLQKSIVRYMKLKHKDIFMNGSLGGVYIQNARHRDYKAKGYTSGFPDLFFYSPRIVEGEIVNGLAIELKVKGNSATENQKNVIGILNKAGYLAIVCTGIDETLEKIEWYLNCTVPEVDVNYTIKK
tara:strand:- start:1605 stop:2003 length:399 start_codon:yes stop_codon:yes gene_type:complete